MASSMQKIKKAVIPVAGLGTRFLPATKAIPKELIPIIDIPMVQYIVEEAVSSGIEHIILVTARNKEAIENHFDFNYELEERMQKAGKKNLAELSASIGANVVISSVRQKNPMGLGHAVLSAAPLVGDEPFAVLLGDDLIDAPQNPATKQLIGVAQKLQGSVIGVMSVPRDQVSKYGIIEGTPVEGSERTWKMKSMVEKPQPDQAPSELATPGRYVFSPEIFEVLRQTKPGRGGEIQLTDAIATLAKSKPVYAYEFTGDRYDTGDQLGYLEATIAFGLKRPELKQPLMALMKKYLGKSV